MMFPTEQCTSLRKQNLLEYILYLNKEKNTRAIHRISKIRRSKTKGIPRKSVMGRFRTMACCPKKRLVQFVAGERRTQGGSSLIKTTLIDSQVYLWRLSWFSGYNPDLYCCSGMIIDNTYFHPQKCPRQDIKLYSHTRRVLSCEKLSRMAYVWSKKEKLQTQRKLSK